MVKNELRYSLRAAYATSLLSRKWRKLVEKGLFVSETGRSRNWKKQSYFATEALKMERRVEDRQMMPRDVRLYKLNDTYVYMYTCVCQCQCVC